MVKVSLVQKITLRSVRCNRGLSLQAVAKKVGIAVEELEVYEQDSRIIPCSIGAKLFRLYNISASDVHIGVDIDS